ncbi:MAG: efflux RND transporter permease subunit [Thermoanaerobaculales bacterium]|jgi:HAE1 family hydrophobic/amphiphilic exporter-1|nr:efflux RND transporter permease subunit [Thermoanaerobaculales bacterium]
MNLYDIAIRRPVFTAMLMIALVVFGVLGYQTLPINLLPSLDIPVVTVITLLPGASPEVMESDVTDVIEAAVNTIEGIKQLTSYSGQGVSQVTVTFTLERDIDIAAQDVRDKVSGAVGQLPLDAEPPIVQKFDVNSQPMLWMALAGLDARELSDYADQVVKPQLQAVPGVGNVLMPGFREPMMRIWVDRDRLAAHRLTVDDVIVALGRENLELPGGYIEGPLTELAVRNLGLFETVDDFNAMILATVEGRPIRLADVGFTQLGIADERGGARYNLTPTLGLGVAPRSGANLVDVNRAVRQRMEELKADFPPGLFYDVAFDGAEYVERSIANVQVDILYGAILAIVVVFVFLRSWRSTFIVSLAIPTSLIATFGFMRMFGFSLNNLTTLALALSVGVVIDDAIVVLENIYRHQEEGESPFQAAHSGTHEIALAAMAATFSIAAVFVPVAYMEGMIGQFLFEFGISVAVAILISLFVALTLTPMLCSRILRVKPKHGRLYEALERAFEGLESGYSRGLDWVLRHKILTLVGSTAVLLASLALTPLIGAEFAPAEDMSSFMITTKAPVGTSLEAMDRMMQQVERVVLSQPEIRSGFMAIDLEERGQVNTGILFLRMLKPDERTTTQAEVVQRLRRDLAGIEGIQAFVIEFSFYNVAGEGGEKALAYSIRGPELDELQRIGDAAIERLATIPGFVDLDHNLDLEQPQLFVRVDRERAHDLGLDAAAVYQTVYSLIAGREVGSYTTQGKRYDVRIKVRPDQALSPQDIGALQVRTPSGDMVRLDSVVEISHGVGPININRTDRERSLLLTANLEGLPLNRALEQVEEVLAELLPPGYHAKPTGTAEEFAESMSSLLFALGLAVLIVYMLLASQFNSLIHPFTIMLALPPALVGALLALLVTGYTINIMSVIGIILLFGLVTKNSILLVDLTIQRQEAGLDREAALREACPIRLRPILMTAISMIFGVLPVALALGEGGEARAPMAVATAGGMITSTALTLFLVPVVYAYLDRLATALRGHESRSRQETVEDAAAAEGPEAF